MTKEKKEKKSLLVLLLSAGLLSFIGGIIGLVYNTYHKNQLDDQVFQHELIHSAMKIEDKEKRADYIKLLYKTELLDNCLINDSILTYELEANRGRNDGAAAKSITSSLKSFYQIYGRMPENLKELILTMRVKKSVDHFQGNIYYRKISDGNMFKLIFPGVDGYLHTVDDKSYDNKKLGINNNNE